MEKYGVEEKPQEDKTAKDPQTCPKCGAELKDTDTTGGLKVCPKCGTEPFEAE